MRPIRTVAWLFVSVAISAFSAGQGRHRVRECENYELQGPIHTQRATVKMLNEKPPGKHLIVVQNTPEAWLVFGPAGDLIERGELDESGKVQRLVREKQDAEGETIESTVSYPDKTLHYEVERSKSSSGITETTTLLDGKPFSRQVTSFNAETGEGESKSFDKNGEEVSRIISHRTPLTREAEFRGKDGKFIYHTFRRIDDQGQLIESVCFDPEGRVMSDLRFKDQVLTSWWQDPKCDCTNGAWVDPGGVPIFYSTTQAGRLLKSVTHYAKLDHEIEDDEVYDENDLLLDRIAYTYERDHHGNWIRRIASMLDVKTGAMIPIREDVRTLTYY